LIGKDNIRVFDDFSAGVAQFFAEWTERELRSREVLYVALSGGRTPGAVYEVLAQGPYRDAIRWPGIHFFVGDERPVAYDHPDSNWGMASRTLLDPVGVPESHRHPMPTGGHDLACNADAYAEELRRHLPMERGMPVFDLIFLGLGADGHTASLFPGTAALHETQRLVVANEVPKLATTRLTLTYPIINHARHVVFLVAGAAKAAIVRRVLIDRDASLPAAHVLPTHGTLTWLVDREAMPEMGRRNGDAARFEAV
jgi:6-phosphogluconolactonase